MEIFRPGNLWKFPIFRRVLLTMLAAVVLVMSVGLLSFMAAGGYKRILEIVKIKVFLVVDHSLFQSWEDLEYANEDHRVEDINFYYSHIINSVAKKFAGMESDSYNYVVSVVGMHISQIGDNSEIIRGESSKMFEHVKWIEDEKKELATFEVLIMFTRHRDMISSEHDPKSPGCSNHGAFIIHHNQMSTMVLQTAHKLAHILGAKHDGESGDCNEKEGHIMTPYLNANETEDWTFLKCSRKYMDKYIGQTKRISKECLNKESSHELDQHQKEKKDEENGVEDENQEEEGKVGYDIWDKVREQLPGRRFSPDKSCQIMFGRHSYYCPPRAGNPRDICHDFKCFIPNEYDCFPLDRGIAIDGISCANKFWCVDGRCMYNEKAPALDGNKRILENIHVKVYIIIDYTLFQSWLDLDEKNVIDVMDEISYYYNGVIDAAAKKFANMESDLYNYIVSAVGIHVIVFKNDPLLVPIERLNMSNPAIMNYSSVLLELVKWIESEEEEPPLFDVVILFTRHENVTSGHAILNSSCSDQGAFILQHSQTSTMALLAAHELAHVLGAKHDGESNECNEKEGHIMTPYLNQIKTIDRTFSNCSRKSMDEYVGQIKRIKKDCFKLKPSKSNKKMREGRKVNNVFWDKLRELPPGAKVSPNKSCQVMFGKKSYYCPPGAENSRSICHNFKCFDPKENDCFAINRGISMDGIPCANKSWCVNGRCTYDRRAPSKDEYCMYGDWRGPLMVENTKIWCWDVLNRSSLCYRNHVNKLCCASCRSVERPEAGNKRFHENINIRVYVLVDSLIYKSWEDLERRHYNDVLDDITHYYNNVINLVSKTFTSMESDFYNYFVSMVALHAIVVRDDPMLEALERVMVPNSNFMNYSSALLELVAWFKAEHKLYIFDVLILFTGQRDVISSGQAFMNFGCSDYGIFIVHHNQRSTMALQAAHGLAHVLGAKHDGESNECNETEGHIMTPYLYANETEDWTFSNCSRKSMEEHIRQVKSNDCFFVGEESKSKEDGLWGELEELPAGVRISADRNCQVVFGKKSSYCPLGAGNSHSICRDFMCFIPEEDDCFFLDRGIAMDGIPCANRSWCVGGRCTYDERAPVINDTEYCMYGDWRGPMIVKNERHRCRNVLTMPGLCYHDHVKKLCCASCRSVEKPEEGNKRFHRIVHVRVYIIVDHSLYKRWEELEKKSLDDTVDDICYYYNNVINLVAKKFANMESDSHDYSVFTSGVQVVSSEDEPLYVLESAKISNSTFMNYTSALVEIRKWVEDKKRGMPAFEVLIMFTSRRDVISSRHAILNSGCSNQGAFIIHQDQASTMALWAAHELAHVLGAKHDGESNECNETGGHIMTRYLDEKETEDRTFSNCSRNSMDEYIVQMKRVNKYCFERKVSGKHGQNKKIKNEKKKLDEVDIFWDKLWNLPAGVRISPDRSCQVVFGNESYYCPTGAESYRDICHDFMCFIPEEDDCFFLDRGIAMDGIPCANRSWCVGGRCTYDERAPVISGTEYCMYGDWRGPMIVKNKRYRCRNVLTMPSLCYHDHVKKLCCASCRSVERPVADCSYGDEDVQVERASKILSCLDMKDFPFLCLKYFKPCCKTCSEILGKKDARPNNTTLVISTSIAMPNTYFRECC